MIAESKFTEEDFR